MIRRISLMLAAGAALFLGATASASAGTVDQQQTSSTTDAGLFAGQSPAQTFTAGISGGLDRADLLLFKLSSPPEPLTVEIRNTSLGAPGTSVLASGSIPSSALGPEPAAFVPVTFATPAAVTAGTRYALVTYTEHANNDYAGWRYQTTTNPYSGGGGFVSNEPNPPQGGWHDVALGGDDFAFKTYVTPPPLTTNGSPTTPTIVKKKKCKKHKKKHAASSAKKKKCKKKKKK